MHSTSADERVSIDRMALIAVHMMSPEERASLFRILSELAVQPPEQWPADLVRRLPTPEPLYLLRFDDEMRIFFRPNGEGRLAIADTVSQVSLDRYFSPRSPNGQ